MNIAQLEEELQIKGRTFSILRMKTDRDEKITQGGCSLRALNEVAAGKTLYFKESNLTCSGAARGFGLSEAYPATPGGVGYFLSTGRGEGYPAGERVKCCPEVGLEMLDSQPANVMDGLDTICVKPYEDTDTPDTVALLVNPDQLSALAHLFSFDTPDYDRIYVGMTSGCASVFRLPFAEMKKENPRAVIGNADVFSRPFFPADSFFFTVSGRDFERILHNADHSIFQSPIWKGVKRRLP